MTKLPGEPVRQFAVMLPNRAGSLEALMHLLHQSRVELLGLGVQDSRDATVARIVTSDPDITEQIFMEKGIAYTESTLVVVAMRDPNTELRKCLNQFHASETNVDFVYALFPHPDGRTLVAFHLEDNDFGQSVLHNAGMKIISQEDLSR